MHCLYKLIRLAIASAVKMVSVQDIFSTLKLCGLGSRLILLPLLPVAPFLLMPTTLLVGLLVLFAHDALRFKGEVLGCPDDLASIGCFDCNPVLG